MTGTLTPIYIKNPSNPEQLGKPDEENYVVEPEKEQLTGTKYGRQTKTSFSPTPSLGLNVEKTLEEKGVDEYTKNQATQTEADRESVDSLVKSSNRCIMSISSQFPWDIFPNTINVEESRVTFIFRQFLASQSHSVDIQDISNVFIESSPFFATLQIVSKTFIQNDIKIGKLDRKKAIKARMIIEGLRTLGGHNLDTSSYKVEELISKIEEMHASQGGQM